MFKGTRARGGGVIPTDASVTVAKLTADVVDAIVGTPDLTVYGNEASTLEVVCQLKDASGNNLTRKTVLRAWLSDSPAAGVTTAADFTACWDPAALETIVANKDWDVLTDASGKATVTVSKVGNAVTLYLNVAIEEQITSVEFTVGSAVESVGQYGLFEIAPTVETASVYPYWPYDTSPNGNIPAGVGVSIDGLFSNDNWQTYVVQPGFYFQDYTHETKYDGVNPYDWMYPSGEPGWRIRFTPTTVGTWKYKVRVKDAAHPAGVLSDEKSFYCRASSNHGFIKVSASDWRYFETSDGAYVNFMGLSYCPGTQDFKKALFEKYGANRINLVRPWWEGSQGPVLFGLSGQNLDMGEWQGDPSDDVSVDYAEARSGEIFSGKIVANATAFIKAHVKPSTTYRYAAWVKAVGVTGTGTYGVYLEPEATPLGDAVHPTDWTEISGSFTTGPTTYLLNWVKLIMANTTAGAIHFTDVSLKEDLGGGTYGPELLNVPSFNKQTYISQRESWKADQDVEVARTNGVYLKVVLQCKQDRIFGSIAPSGAGQAFDQSGVTVYASDSHAGRTYQQYYWRYIIARYGYATNIHSFEFCNEGDGFLASCIAAVEAFASYFHNNDPNDHLCTTSNWGSAFPTTEMWSALVTPHVGYMDRHQYVGKGADPPLQYEYGWHDDGHGGLGDLRDAAQYRSSPYSLHFAKSEVDGSNRTIKAWPIPVTPGHDYTLSWWLKGIDLTLCPGVSQDWQFPSIIIHWVTGWQCCYTGDMIQPSGPSKLIGTFDWTHRTIPNTQQGETTFTAPSDAHYIELILSLGYLLGDVWFDDVTLFDETDQVAVEIPNGNFDQPSGTRMEYDTALCHYSVGGELGYGTRRQVHKPMTRGEFAITDGVGDHDELVNDSEGVWFRKLVWAHINAFGVIDMYWYPQNLDAYNLHYYVKAYQAFMAGIPLSNGHYEDIAATISGSAALRVFGQKDLTNNQLHLWIDNANDTWKNVVDKVEIPPASGQVQIPVIDDGFYYADVYDPATGEITGRLDGVYNNGLLTLQVTDLMTDIAYRIYLTPKT